MIVVHLDYETRSKADLKSVGAYRYACDPTTEILLCAVSADDSDEVYLWVNPKYRTADVLGDENERAMDLLNRANVIYAHNAPFEIAISWGCKDEPAIFQQQNGSLDQWRCTMAMARKAGLPQSLGQLAETLGLDQQKDKEGSKLIKLFSIPQKDGNFIAPKTRPDEWYQFGEYCRQDVRTEKGIHKKMKAFELTGDSLATFQFDLRMNQLGIPVNAPALKNAQVIIDQVQQEVTEEFVKITGVVPSRRAAVKEWLEKRGMAMADMTADTVELAISETTDTSDLRELRPDWSDEYDQCNRVLRLYQKVGYAAVKKVASMLDWACHDERMRGVMKYYGAGTGRWSAGGPQIQNAKKTTKELRPHTEGAYKYIMNGGTAEGLEVVYDDTLEVISCCIRHFVHAPGHALLDGDYNAIEARIICWLAGQTDILQLWREGKDLYKVMAAHAYGIDASAVSLDQREVGKRLELGCGYQMGADKFQSSCLEQYQLALPLDLCERGVAMYRETHPKVVQYWYYLQNQAKAAINNPGKPYGPFIIKRVAGIIYLLFKLRSGRELAYPHPQIIWETTVEADPKQKGKTIVRKREQITYWGQLPLSTQWGRVKLYGGKLAENETQATAADIMAYGAITAEKQGMMPFALIHDQALAEQPEGKTAEDFAAALGTLPPWAKGLPVKVEVKVAPFYRK